MLIFGGDTMFPNLDAEQARHGETNSFAANMLNLSRASYENKKRNGKFTILEAKILCSHYGCEFNYLFDNGKARAC